MPQPKRTPEPLPQSYLTLAQAAAYLGITPGALQKRCARQEVPHRRWRGRYVLIKQELDAFIVALEGCTVNQALDHLGVEP